MAEREEHITEDSKQVSSASEAPQSDAAPTQKPKRGMAVRLAPILVVVLLLGAAFAVLSRPTPGRRTSTDTSVTVVLSTAAPQSSAQYAIELQEGGDAAHESDHIFETLQGVEGVADATLDWSTGVVLLVRFDPSVISGQEITQRVAESGYLAAEPQ